MGNVRRDMEVPEESKAPCTDRDIPCRISHMQTLSEHQEGPAKLLEKRHTSDCQYFCKPEGHGSYGRTLIRAMITPQ